jgi:ketosteroid isomerase-like protein
MSQEEVEIVRQVIELMPQCYRAGEATAALLELLAPEFRVDASHRVFNPDVYEGAAGMQRLIREVNDAWEDFRETTERIVDVGDRVLVLQAISGRGRASGLEVRSDGALIFAVSGDRVASVEVFTDPDEALKSLELGA